MHSDGDQRNPTKTSIGWEPFWVLSVEMLCCFDCLLEHVSGALIVCLFVGTCVCCFDCLFVCWNMDLTSAVAFGSIPKVAAPADATGGAFSVVQALPALARVPVARSRV